MVTTLLLILQLLYVLHVIVLYVDVFVGHLVYELIVGYFGLAAVDEANVEDFFEWVEFVVERVGALAEYVGLFLLENALEILDLDQLLFALFFYLLIGVEAASYKNKALLVIFFVQRIWRLWIRILFL